MIGEDRKKAERKGKEKDKKGERGNPGKAGEETVGGQ